MKKLKVALVTDTIIQFGGAHRFLMSIKKIFPQADIFTAFYEPKNFKEYMSEMKDWNVITPKIDTRFFRKIFGSHYTIISPLIFENFTFDSYDLVISLSAGASKGIVTPTTTKHISIILTPIRYHWKIDDPNYYIKNLKTRKLLKLPLLFLDSIIRIWDYSSAQRADEVISISENIKALVTSTYHRNSTIIHPPVELPQINLFPKPVDFDYYIAWSRLYPYKRIDLAIKACIESKKHLVIIGNGPEEKHLKTLANDSVFIHFLGWLPDSQLYNYVKYAKALIFCGLEDFGLVMVESILLGTPVIAFKKGGAIDIVRENETGLFFGEQEIEAIKVCMHTLEHAEWLDNGRVKKRFIDQARKRFSLEEFKLKMLNIVKPL